MLYYLTMQSRTMPTDGRATRYLEFKRGVSQALGERSTTSASGWA